MSTRVLEALGDRLNAIADATADSIEGPANPLAWLDEQPLAASPNATRRLLLFSDSAATKLVRYKLPRIRRAGECRHGGCS
jgi:hypothetical protein